MVSRSDVRRARCVASPSDTRRLPLGMPIALVGITLPEVRVATQTRSKAASSASSTLSQASRKR